MNLQTSNPETFTARVDALQAAVLADEAALVATKYTAAGAISAPGVALLQAGSAAAMTLAAPIAGAPAPGGSGGNDGQRLLIVAMDAEAYTVTTPADKIIGADDTLTWTAAVGNNVELVAWNGVWWLVGTPRGVALSEV